MDRFKKEEATICCVVINLIRSNLSSKLVYSILSYASDKMHREWSTGCLTHLCIR